MGEYGSIIRTWIYKCYGDRAIVGIDATTSTLEENSISLNEILTGSGEKRVSRVVIVADWFWKYRKRWL